MAAIKFSKQYIEPNPNEIDYWVDLSSNQYGGRMKYYNGFEWVDLVNPDGTHIDINDFYNKLQINQMLSQKASVDSVESKVDDDEVSDVIKNISFSQRGEDGVEMVMFKYDDTTVGIQLPIADNTKSGIITKDTFKNLVNLTQLQQLYSEMYTKLSEIRNNYQPKLRAGANIKIENNVISAVSKISTDWNDIANKPDIYDKSQVDTMMSGVYKIKGSRTFEELPTEGNNIGDTYNITNSFTLNGEEYELGTNVVWTEEGWDALAGIFDTSELEEDIQEVKDNYLPLSGGTINGVLNLAEDLRIANYRALQGRQKDGTLVNMMFVNLSNAIQVGYDKSQLQLVGTNLIFGNYKIWHEGNDGHDSGLDADTLDGIHAKDFLTSNNVDTFDITDISYKPGIYSFLKPAESDIFKNDFNYGKALVVKTPDSDTFFALLSGYSHDKLLYRRGNNNNIGSTLWKQIAFTDYNGFYDLYGGKEIPANSDLNDYKTIGTYSVTTNIVAQTISNCPISISFTLHVLNPVAGNHYIRQELTNWSTAERYYRTYTASSSTWSDWKAVNSLTSTKLATPIKLWGNDFDGSSNISGPVYLENGNAIYSKDSTGANRYLFMLDPGNAFNVGGGTAIKGYNTAIYGNNINFFYSAHRNNGMTINSIGNVGIGTTDPQSKLDVVGGIKTSSNLRVTAELGTTTVYPWGLDINADNPGITFFSGKSDTRTLRLILHSADRLTCEGGFRTTGMIESGGHVYIPNNNALTLYDTKAIPHRSMMIGNDDTLLIGHDSTSAGYPTYIDGNNLYFRYGTNHSTGIILNSSGNVTIGGSDLAGSDHKLHVDGEIAVTKHASLRQDVSICNNLAVGHQITSGDLVDWYGVSWSEDSSDPTCTRIGNMALHRSLPILSAMKGYSIINNTATTVTEMIIPLTDDWSSRCYNDVNNSATGNPTRFKGSNTMVKIPEFWYIDEYESSTKTHNLKISQTAKAGWCHHKEAYVGAYEGYLGDIVYHSTAGVIPTVSATREQLRTKARANGYEDEYKWNIYTYEEHRAICHLFLVEYATRNSQAPVNTALTADGFKQGGLGSGCTTGTVKINGVDTYSFIPTGTTDSLGNGSGQVAYTVTQTDADGNEIDTVTRYANRYRGIENPFGHIWKHVDDVVNVYNAETTYKTVYKCDKPEHFATNKNAKYKPLCSFPGGSKMQGWSKEIKATINCDFFKCYVGGSESTYWCDYNYDSDDTSEHCLLIGGGSGSGGQAGLFAFLLHGGVGTSNVSVGSRLTYLPWAE